MKPKTLGVAAATIALLLAACSPAPNTQAPTSAPTHTPTSVPTDTPEPTVAPTEAAATETALDPCLLVPSDEASALAGVTFGEGEEEPLESVVRCVYGAETTNVFTVEVGQGPDQDTVDEYKQAFLDDLNAQAQQLASHSLNVTQVPDFADGAVLAQLALNVQGVPINAIAFGFTYGTVFFGVSDVAEGMPAPTVDAVEAEATTVLGRLP